MSGLLGSHLARWCKNSNNFDIYPHQFDLIDDDATKKIIKDFNPDYFINCAGIPNPDYGDVFKLFNINCLPVFIQLRYIEKYAPKCKYVNCGTVLELNDKRSYPLSKKCARNVMSDFKDRGVFAIQPYLGNFTSENQSEEFLMPKLIRHFKNREFPIELGNLDIIKSFLYVSDTISAIWYLINNEIKEDVIIKSNEFYSIYNLVKKIAEIVGIEFNDSMIKVNKNLKRVEFNKLKFDIKNIQDLGWRQEKSIKNIVDIMMK